MYTTYGIVACGAKNLGLNTGYNFDSLTIENNEITKAGIAIAVISASNGKSDLR